MLKRFLGAQWIAIVVVGGLSFMMSVFVARRFGPDLFGVYAQAISLGAFLCVLIDGGFGKLLMRETVLASPELSGESANIHGIAFGYALMAMAFFFVLALLNPFSLDLPTLLATVGTFGISVLVNFSMVILRGQGRLVRDALWQISNRIFTATFIVAGLALGASMPWEVLTLQFAGSLAFLLFLMRSGWVRPIFKIPCTVHAIVLPLVGLDLATVIYFRSDMLLFKLTGVPRGDVGVYSVAYRLIEAALLLASPVALLLFRHFRLRKGTFDGRALRGVVRLAGLAAGLGFLVFLLGWFTADFFFPFVFGQGFAQAADLFKILSLMLVFALANGVLGQGVFALGLDRHYLGVATAAAIFNVFGNLMFLRTHGVLAAAWMTVATEVVLGLGLSVALFVAWKNGNDVERAG